MTRFLTNKKTGNKFPVKGKKLSKLHGSTKSSGKVSKKSLKHETGVDKGTWAYWWKIIPVSVKQKWLEEEKIKPVEISGNPNWREDEEETQRKRDAIDPIGDSHANWVQIQQMDLDGWMANHIYDDEAREFLFGKEKNWKKVHPDTGKWEGDYLDKTV